MVVGTGISDDLGRFRTEKCRDKRLREEAAVGSAALEWLWMRGDTVMRTFAPQDTSVTSRAPLSRPNDAWDELSSEAIELAQRGRMILDVATLDLAVAESRLGPSHETTWFFRTALADAREAWTQLRAEYGVERVEAALARPPVAVLTLGVSARLIAIGGKTYRVERVRGTAAAPVIWQFSRLLPPLEHGPFYHACRLADGSTQCDCADWSYTIAGFSDAHCKHLAAVAALGWL
jgi:hypothetical protein